MSNTYLQPSEPKARYGRDWAAGVVRQLHDKHPRVFDIVCIDLHLTEGQLITILQTRPKVWASIRTFIRWWVRAENTGQKLPELALRLTSYRDYANRKDLGEEKEWKSYLTGLISAQ